MMLPATYVKRSIEVGDTSFERYFASYEERALKSIEPFFYLKDTADPVYAFHVLQKTFHVLLRKFLKVRHEDFALVARKEISNCQYLAALLDPAAAEMLPIRDGEAFVCGVYSFLKNKKPTFGKAQTKTREFDIPFDLEVVAREHPSAHYKKIHILKKWVGEHLREDVSLFVVHGSFATGDFFEGWSDLDMAVILKDEVFSSPERLVRVRKMLSRAGLLCYLVDPLAHHELMVFTAFDQDYYQEDTLPLSAYENGMLLFGDKHVKCVERDSHEERLHRLAWYVAWYRKMVTEEKWADNWYDWKNVVGTAMLMPAMAVGAQGEYLYKRESFARAKELYPTIDWSIVDEVSGWREGWSAHSWVSHLPTRLVLALPYDISRRIIMRLLRPTTHKSPRESKETIERVTRSTLELMENILKANV